ncbi:hypothetical protein CC80DRAFT_390149, partial [Byssothecium circinans]
LPAELVEHLAKHLEVASFRSFRLACSSLHQKSLHHFKERFFHRRTLQWSKFSFKQLEEITSHAQLGNDIRELVVDATPHYAIKLWKLKNAIANAQEDSVKRELVKAHFATEREADEAARYWSETRHDQRTLISVFGQMHQLQSIIFAYDGMDHRLITLCRKYCEGSQNEMSRPFVSTLAALATANLRVQTIVIDPTKKYGAVSIGRLESISPILALFDDAFLNLQALQLTLRDWRQPDEGFELPTDRTPFLVRFLAKAGNLRSLDLSYFSYLEGDILQHMARHCRYPHLDTCKLELLAICCSDDLFNFLQPTKNSLRSLSLHRLVLKEQAANWCQVLRRVAADLALDSLELKDLFAQLGASVWFE